METGLACTCNPLKGKCMVSYGLLVWKGEESIQGFLARIARKGERVGLSNTGAIAGQDRVWGIVG